MVLVCYGVLPASASVEPLAAGRQHRQAEEQPLHVGAVDWMVRRLWPVANLALGTDKKADGHGGRLDMADLAAAVVRITKAVERFEADRRRCW